jgi:hypothetical protein
MAFLSLAWPCSESPCSFTRVVKQISLMRSVYALLSYCLFYFIYESNARTVSMFLRFFLLCFMSLARVAIANNLANYYKSR